MGMGGGMSQQPANPYAAPVSGPGVLPPGQMGAMGSPSAAPGPGMPPSKSTAPTASAAPVVEDMPVCWPLPTKMQQKLSTTQATAAANQAIQAQSAGGGSAIGAPLAPHDLEHVKVVLGMLLETSSQDGNAKK